MDEELSVYFSNTGTVQYLTFSNNIVNISNETEGVNYMIVSENIFDFDTLTL